MSLHLAKIASYTTFRILDDSFAYIHIIIVVASRAIATYNMLPQKTDAIMMTIQTKPHAICAIK